MRINWAILTQEWSVMRSIRRTRSGAKSKGERDTHTQAHTGRYAEDDQTSKEPVIVRATGFGIGKSLGGPCPNLACWWLGKGLHLLNWAL